MEGERVGAAIARGEAEIGCQQVSELFGLNRLPNLLTIRLAYWQTNSRSLVRLCGPGP